MTLHRAAPGPQLATGRLRVDAARAIAKLREYRLALRAAWVLEAIRAAAASGATRISLGGDTNDLWLAWDGEPWPAADLPRLFDELVGPEAGGDRYHVRLLAAAVNSALGMDPAYVDVYAIAATGGAVRARYTPDVLDEPATELGEAPLRRIALEPAAPPAGAGPGMAVHLRRRFGFAVISHLVRELPELELARAACADLAVPLLVRGVEHGRRVQRRDVVRVPLGEDLGGFLAAVDPDTAEGHAALEVAEHGVVLSTSALELGFAAGGGAVPLRVFVDAPRMPTNASRSEVRQDVHPVSSALRRARALMPELAAQLAGAVLNGPEPDRARAAALALVAAAGTDAAPGLGLGRLLDLPLLLDAVGARRTLRTGWSAIVHTGASPFPEELAPWLSEVLWIPPGDPSACLVDPDTVDTAGLKRRVRWARREHRAYRRFYGHAPRPPSVEARALPRIRARLGAEVAGSCVAQPGLEGMNGEVCIRTGGSGGELVLLLAGRELERMTYKSPIPFDAVVESPRFAPADRYRSAVRDTEYARAEAAMRGGVVRAIEAIAAGYAGDGFVHGEAASEEADRRLVLDGLALAVELGGGLGLLIGGPLALAPVWKLAGGGAASTVELRGYGAVGTAAPGAVQRSLARRPIVELEPRDEALFEALLPAVRRVPYGGAAAREAAPADPIDLARELLERAGAALVVRGDGCAGAIAAVAAGGVGAAAAAGVAGAAALAGRVVISHAGRVVEERAYTPSLIPCEIHVDGDGVVPDAGWTRVLDDGGAARHFAAWELELVRAAAASLAGSRPDDLLGFAPVELGDPLGRALCGALAGGDPAELLGAELVERLVERPLLRALGGGEPVSARELAARFPGSLLYVDAYTAAVPNYTPLVADPLIARAVGRLVGREVRDARPYIEQRLRLAARDAKLARHRELPVSSLELPDNAPHVVREAGKLRAIVGVARGEGMELHVRVEGRPFAVVRRAGKLPLIAAVEVPLEQVDDDFAEVRTWRVDAIVREVRAAAPALLRAIAAARPAALAELGPIRTLLAAALEDLALDDATRAALVSAEAFPTLQGPRISIARALVADLVSIASWDGEWLGPEPGEAPDPLDLPVLHVPAGADELSAIIGRLHPRVVDVTDAADRLQAQRRMQRGLLPPPAVHGVAPELKRRLADLGDAGEELAFGVGVGELGLVDEPASTALLHVRGVLRDRLALDVLPSVHLAIEAPELVGGLARGADVDLDVIDSVEQLRHLGDRGPGGRAIGPDAQRLAARLVAAIVREQPVLPAWVRHRLRKALLARRVAAEVEGAPLFETVSGEWLDRAALGRQIEQLGDVWCVARPPADPRPLDERRVVLKLSEEEQELARGGGLPFVDATRELELDALARTNRARPPAASLATDPGVSVLAAVPLAGDGITAPRGVVAVLAPGAAAHRGVRAHRELHPFDYSADPCSWPTLAIVDDARLAPDRTWSRPVRDAAWTALVTAIRNTSDAALRDLVRRPRSLVAQAVGAASHAALPALHRDSYTQIRGALWLDGPPGTPGRIEIVREGGTEAFEASRRIAMYGTLYVFSPADPVRLRQALTELCAAVYARFLRALAVRRGSSPELAAAHVAYGLALERIAPADAPAFRLACFRSRPIDAGEWVGLCKSTQRIPLVAPDAVVDELSVTDDGTPLAKVVLEVLGPRAYVDRPVPRPTARPEHLAPLRDADLAAPSAAPEPARPPVAPPRPAHPLDPVIAAVGARLLQLGITPPTFAILEGFAAPMVSYEEDALCFAADHPRLGAIAAALLARTAWREAAVDALVAHAISVLNLALTSVTDATELHLLGGLLGSSPA